MVVTHKVIFDDCRNMLEYLDPESIDFIVTSPPYGNLKDYGHKDQIGYGEMYSEYLDSMQIVFDNCFSVLKPGCKMCMNIGDVYVAKTENTPFRVIPTGSDMILLAETSGFMFMGSVIWIKGCNTQSSGGGSWMGSTYYPRDGALWLNYEYIHIFKKNGLGVTPEGSRKEKSRLTKQERVTWFRSIWYDVPPAQQDGHPAVFPMQIPYRLIRMYSFRGEIVLDPFLGSGTTIEAAVRCGRVGVGFELNTKYKSFIASKLKNMIRPSGQEHRIKFIVPKPTL
jgi:site-specific DNA-methyltransferase (adenine-specific)